MKIVVAMLGLALLALGGAPAVAVEPNEILKDPVLEKRARGLSKNLRCLVCQNQSIDDSNADLARDLRILVRKRLVAGDTDDQILAFVTQRYGDFVLLRPPIKGTTYLLWFGPGALLLIVGGVLIMRARSRRRTADAKPKPLTKAERARLADLMGDRPDRT